MGKRGPRPTPTTTLKLRGSWRGDSRPGEPEAPDGVPVCPEWLGAVGVAKWHETVPLLTAMGVLTLADGDYLAMYCEAWDDLAWANETIASEGRTCTSEKGAAYQHPAVGIKNKAIERIRRFGAEFGMSPASRADLDLFGSKPKENGKSRFFSA